MTGSNSCDIQDACRAIEKARSLLELLSQLSLITPKSYPLCLEV